MKKYISGRLFKSYWEWFALPREIGGVAVANFFSYELTNVPGFTCKEGVTTVIDLTLPLEALWEKARKKYIREQIEKGRRKGIAVALSHDVAAFSAMYRAFARTSSFSEVSRTALENGLLFLAMHEGKVIAGGVFVEDGAHMRALALASIRLTGLKGRERDLVGEANRLVIWHAVEYGKEHGYALLDLGGIAPDSSNAHWRSVAEFKEAFGGTRVPQYYYHTMYSPVLRALRKGKKLLGI